MSGVTRFTPGPWFVCSHDRAATVCASDGLGHIQVAGQPRGNADRRPDAFLIASAPDLYAALDGLVEEIIAANGDGDDVATTVWGAAKAALRKARGES